MVSEPDDVPVPSTESSTINNFRVWGLTSNDEIYTREGVKGTWKRIEGALKQISVGADGRVWGVTSNDEIYTREGVKGTWNKIEGGLKLISVGADGRV